MPGQNYYAMSIEEVLKSLKTSEEGLTENEAKRRLESHGANELEKAKEITPFQIFFRQFTSFIVVILIAAMAVSLLIGAALDAIVIFVIIIINGILGFTQEYRAGKEIDALRKLSALKARVVRSGNEMEIDSRELAKGDVILLESGGKVPADARLILAAMLQVDEASLTGESIATKKDAGTLQSELPVADRRSMVFMGTIITKGRGRAVVTGTGKGTEIGRIAKMVSEVTEKVTPLQEKLNGLGRWLAIATVGICAVVFGAGILREYLATGSIETAFMVEMFLAAVALAVAAIPEGLPAIVTISLGLGVRRMVKRNALIRQLPAVETLGATDVICSDKTGTLTKNEMTVREIFTNNTEIKVTGDGYSPEGGFNSAKGEVAPEDIELLLIIGALCSDARLYHREKWEISGDPTEAALIVSAKKAGIEKSEFEKKFPRVDEIPFDSERKLMTTIHSTGGENVAYVKGAPEVILKRCTHIHVRGKVDRLTDEGKKRIKNINQEMANRALRVLGFAYKSVPKGSAITPEEIESDLIFVGLSGMIDPPREGVKEAIEKCKEAGIRTVIITGDHKLTAASIAKELGLFGEGDRALSGAELDRLGDEGLDEIVEDVAIYARASPEHKVRILDALKKKGHIVAMTGDGVNDAPALKKSDIGIAMGLSGTDVAKEASDMILTDDNFASIVNAVEEGRGIYNNIKQFVQYTLSSNLGEILVIFIAILIGWPLPLIAIQILWVNLLTDGLPGLALGLDPFSKDIMKRPPRKRDEEMISPDVVQNILIVGLVMSIGTLLMFYSYGIETAKAKSIAFTTLVMFQLFNVLTYRAKNFKIDISTSRFVIGSVIISVLLQLLVLYTPLNIAFKTVPLGLFDWIKILLVSSTLYIILELRKFINRKQRAHLHA